MEKGETRMSLQETKLGIKLGHHIQRTIWGEVLDRVPLGEKTEFFEGPLLHFPHALSLREIQNDWSELEGILGPSLLRALQTAEPDGNTKIVPECTAAAGGWCSFFTGDLNLIAHGLLPDPVSGEGKPLQDVNQLCEWIESSVRLDQIVEAIFPLNVTHHVLIDEVRLWTEKVSLLLEKNGTPLEQQEKDALGGSIEIAGILRKKFTERFLKEGNGNTSIKRFTDDDMWEELHEIRNFLFERTRVDPKTRTSLGTDGLLWTQYTGPYGKALKRKGVVDGCIQTILLSEPRQHATPSLRVDENLKRDVTRFFEETFDGDDAFWNPGGINEDMGQIAMIPCFSRRGPVNSATNAEWKTSQRVVSTTKGSRQQCTTADVPNLANWEIFIEKLDPSIVPERLCDSDIFLWAANLLTSDPDSVLRMLDLVDVFRGDHNSRQSQGAIAEHQDTLKARIETIIRKTFIELRDKE